MHGQQSTSRYTTVIVPTSLEATLVQVITLSSSECLPTPDTVASPNRLFKGLESCISPTSQIEIPITDQVLTQRFLSRHLPLQRCPFCHRQHGLRYRRWCRHWSCNCLRLCCSWCVHRCHFWPNGKNTLIRKERYRRFFIVIQSSSGWQPVIRPSLS